MIVALDQEYENAAAYHADVRTYGHSMIERFLESRPKFRMLYVTRTLAQKEPSASMRLGTTVHALLLQPDDVGLLIAVAPDINRQTKVGKEAWVEFQEANARKCIITPEQWETARRMADSARQDEMVRDLMDLPGTSERPMRWTHPATGLPMKCLFDRLLDCDILLDIKTAADPNPERWVRQAGEYGYHRQSALYRHAYSVLFDRKCGDFLHIVIGNEEPHEVAPVSFDEQSLDFGHQQNETSLAELKSCIENNDWSSRWANGIQRVSLPPWLMREASFR